MSYQKYKYCIDKIFLKYEYIKRIETLRTTGFSEYSLDNISVQLRKMVEYLLLGIGILHQEALIKAQHYFEHKCTSKSLFEVLENINKSFFPISTSNENFLNQQKLHKIFELTSRSLHVTNPFLLKTQKHIDRKMRNIFAKNDELIEILRSHSITLYNGDELFYKKLPDGGSVINIKPFCSQRKSA